jgi:hypothetical protein
MGSSCALTAKPQQLRFGAMPGNSRVCFQGSAALLLCCFAALLCRYFCLANGETAIWPIA